MRGVTQICLTVSGLCVVVSLYVGAVRRVIRLKYIPVYFNYTPDCTTALKHTQPTHSETYLCNTTYFYSTYQHKAITSRSRQLLMMGMWLPETCWATSRREIKNSKVTSSWFFSSTQPKLNSTLKTSCFLLTRLYLTLTLLMWRIWWAANASKCQMGFNAAFKVLIIFVASNTAL